MKLAKKGFMKLLKKIHSNSNSNSINSGTGPSDHNDNKSSDKSSNNSTSRTAIPTNASTSTGKKSATTHNKTRVRRLCSITEENETPHSDFRTLDSPLVRLRHLKPKMKQKSKYEKEKIKVRKREGKEVEIEGRVGGETESLAQQASKRRTGTQDNWNCSKRNNKQEDVQCGKPKPEPIDASRSPRWSDFNPESQNYGISVSLPGSRNSHISEKSHWSGSRKSSRSKSRLESENSSESKNNIKIENVAILNKQNGRKAGGSSMAQVNNPLGLTKKYQSLDHKKNNNREHFQGPQKRKQSTEPGTRKVPTRKVPNTQGILKPQPKSGAGKLKPKTIPHIYPVTSNNHDTAHSYYEINCHNISTFHTRKVSHSGVMGHRIGAHGGVGVAHKGKVTTVQSQTRSTVSGVSKLGGGRGSKVSKQNPGQSASGGRSTGRSPSLGRSATRGMTSRGGPGRGLSGRGTRGRGGGRRGGAGGGRGQSRGTSGSGGGGRTSSVRGGGARGGRPAAGGSIRGVSSQRGSGRGTGGKYR